ncbi:MAG TPA: sulfite exporter TauE/SafE family protein [Paracoccaceae bacterium]|nr:sulfite exporter TauE/SafE family protein [Paracoccaceae bacterium]
MEGLLQFLPDGMQAGVLAALVAGSFASSLITAAFGIGGGGMLLAIMATLVPPQALIPVHGIVQLGSNAGRMLMLLRQVFWPAIPVFAAGSLVGSVAGGLVVVDLPGAVVQIGVGCFVIWTVVARPPRWLRDMPFVGGLISSFLTMFFGATGLFVASYTKSLALGRHAHVATHATLMTLQHGLKVVVFGFLGFAFGDWWAVIVLMIVAGAAGTWVGSHVLNHIDDRRFHIALNVLLVVISLRLIWQGLAEYGS